MYQASITMVGKENLESHIGSGRSLVSELKTDGALVRIYKDDKTGEQIIVIDGGGDDVIIAS